MNMAVNYLPSWRRVLLEKPTVAQPVDKFLSFHIIPNLFHFSAIYFAML
jgi:hypothetical protein